MLIIEGGDLVGKTTFCETLLEQPLLKSHAYLYNHMTKPPEAFDGCQAYLDMAYHRYVQDRFHLSEIVYAKMRGDEPKVSAEKYRLVDAHMRLLGAVNVVIVCTEPDMIAERWAERVEQEMYDVDKTLLANVIFRDIASTKHFTHSGGICAPDLDVVIVTNREKPFPDEGDVQRVLALYETRQIAVGEVLGQ